MLKRTTVSSLNKNNLITATLALLKSNVKGFGKKLMGHWQEISYNNETIINVKYNESITFGFNFTNRYFLFNQCNWGGDGQ